MLTQEYVREILDYDPLTGIFRWKKQRRGILPGWVAGMHQKYIRIKIDDRLYPAHHLAWLVMTGGWPPQQIDHIDLNKHNNSWVNLRLATPSQNCANRKVGRDSKSGLKGVSPIKANGKWGAFIKINGRNKNLGTFTDPSEAYAAYCTAAKAAFGEFART